MSGIAEILHNLGYAVQGSDVADGANVKRLQGLGIAVRIGHRAENLGAARVVVVLPWLPETATPYLSRISSASISARGITGMPRRRASATSGFVGRTAVEVTTTWASPTFPAAWPAAIRAPSEASRSVTPDGFRSEPVTR